MLLLIIFFHIRQDMQHDKSYKTGNGVKGCSKSFVSSKKPTDKQAYGGAKSGLIAVPFTCRYMSLSNKK